MWLDEGELERIEETHEHDYTEELARMPDLGYQAHELALQKSQRTIHCPKCAAELEAMEYARCSAVLIDACPKCRGIWLDKGELESLEVFFERARAQASDARRGFFASLTSLFRE
jgi:Zn-finger nucleic acid-binding protein